MSRITKAVNVEELIASEIKMAAVVANRKDFISTGNKEVDDAIKGFRFGELVLIGARPAMGRTKYLLRSLLRISEKVPALLCTLDNNGRGIANRIISIKMNGGRTFFVDHIGNLDTQINATKEKLLISDTTFSSMEEYILLLAKYIVNDGVKVIAIDDFHYLPESTSRLSSLELLKEIAEIFRVSIIVTDTVSAKCESRKGDRRPRLKDLNVEPHLRDTLDVVLLLYRPEYYGFRQDEYGASTAGKLEVIIAKNRENEPLDFKAECLFNSIEND